MASFEFLGCRTEITTTTQGTAADAGEPIGHETFVKALGIPHAVSLAMMFCRIGIPPTKIAGNATGVVIFDTSIEALHRRLDANGYR